MTSKEHLPETVFFFPLTCQRQVMICKTEFKPHDPVSCGIKNSIYTLNQCLCSLQSWTVSTFALTILALATNEYRRKQPSEGTVLGQQGQLALAAQS